MYEEDKDMHVPRHLARGFVAVGNDELESNEDVNEAIKAVGDAVSDLEDALDGLSKTEWSDAEEVAALAVVIEDGYSVYKQLDRRYVTPDHEPSDIDHLLERNYLFATEE